MLRSSKVFKPVPAEVDKFGLKLESARPTLCISSHFKYHALALKTEQCEVINQPSSPKLKFIISVFLILSLFSFLNDMLNK